MDTIKIKDNSFVYSYKGGLKTAFCRDLVAIECDKPFIWLVFNNEKVLTIDFLIIPLSGLILSSLGNRNNLKVNAKSINITDKKNNFL